MIDENFLLINKPAGWTSFDVVNFVRKKMRAERKEKNIKVGHAGTLDPFATGLLIVGVGRDATKQLDNFKNLKKTYIATIKLGEVSDTQDSTGTITKIIEQSNNGAIPNIEKINSVVEQFKGKQNQIPPMHSAKKIGGQRLYKLARQGIEIERPPSPVEIYEINVLEYAWPILKIEVSCSAGTYIRTLAQDIGERLGVGAYCHDLVRTRIGDYTLEMAKSVDQLE